MTAAASEEDDEVLIVGMHPVGGTDSNQAPSRHDGATRGLTPIHREVLAVMETSDESEADGGMEARETGSASGSTGGSGQGQGPPAPPRGGLGAWPGGDHVPATERGLFKFGK